MTFCIGQKFDQRIFYSKIMPTSPDIIGQACLDYYAQPEDTKKIEVWCNIAETDHIPVSHLFRTFPEMPYLEKIALQHCRDRILDLGAGAGSHALHLQQEGFQVWGAEISQGACTVMKNRGLKNIIQQDIFTLSDNQKYDTLLMLMNGIGVVGSIDRLKYFFSLARRLLTPNGQILVDSSDLRYLFLEDDGSILINLNDKYYGEVEYRMSYKNQKGRSFPWLFIDDQLLAHYAQQNGFHFEKIAEGEHYDYLARLSRE
jgi:SAM-dependent methyltransferase